MAGAGPNRGWRPHAAKRGRSAGGPWSAFLFNVSLVLFAAASAGAFYIVSTDRLYQFEYSPTIAAKVRARIERQAGEVIQIDFDRRRQWDDLIAMELMNGDIAAARGFLLSARAMLSPGDANMLSRELRRDADDAEVELAALELLTPGTRARYESTVPLLSRRAATTDTAPPPAPRFNVLGDERDFELLASAMLADPDSDALHFVLTGLGLGLGGEMTPRMAAGASALVAASRRTDFADRFAEEIGAAITAAAPLDRFRTEARSRAEAAEGAEAASFTVASAAFRSAVDRDAFARATAILDELGAISEATSPAAAALMITHARSMRDLPRLRLVAEAAGDRAAAAAKRAARDGALPRAAEGTLHFSNKLIGALALAGLAALAMAFSVFATSFSAVRTVWQNLRDAERDDELVTSFDTPWRAL